MSSGWSLYLREKPLPSPLPGGEGELIRKYFPDLLLLGFAPAVPPPGHGNPDAQEGVDCDFVEPNLTVFCNECENTTRYQLKYSLDGEEWEELYADDENSYTYDPTNELRYYKVRARNKNGFSDWSNTIEFEPPEVPE